MKIRGLAAGTAIAALLVYVTGPSLAQNQDDGGLRVSLGLQQNFGFGDNLALGVPGSATNPEEGTTTLSTTAFALNVESVTRSEEFAFQTGAALRFGSTPAGSNVETGFVDPFVALRYARQGADARFLFDAEIRESSISQSRPLWDFSNDSNDIVPPSDLSGLQGTGIRREYDAQIELELGQQAPVGVLFSASATGVDYRNATSATLNDFDRRAVSVKTFFRFDAITTAVADFRLSRFSENTGLPDRDTRVAEFGIDRELGDQSSLSVRLGYTDADPDALGNPSGSKGVSGSLSYQKPLPDGGLNASYSLRRTSDGDIQSMTVGRNFDLPLGSLAVNVGASSIFGATPRVIGGVNWARQTPNGNYSIRLNRQVLPDSNDDNRFTTTLAAQFRQEVTAYSSLVANFSYYVADGSALSNKVERSDIELGYEYALNEDWNLNTGINLRVRDETSVGRAESQQVFFSLSRRFDLR